MILCDDIWWIIILLINDKDKTNLFSTCKYLRYFRDKVYYTDIYNYRKVLYLPFFNNFTSLNFIAETPVIPNGIKYLTISNNFRGSLKIIPLSVIKITIDYCIYNKFESFLEGTGAEIHIINKPYTRRVKSSIYGFMDVLEDTCGPKCGLITSIEPFLGYNTEDGILFKNVMDDFSNYVSSHIYSYENILSKLIKKYLNRTTDPLSKKIPLKKLLKKYNKKEKIYHPHNNKFYKNNKYKQKFIPRHK
uniref:F-box and FNIp repeat-containing protein n=1 Tax=Borely moumouvirus TaxID=2712067 RepID=A0A6G6ACA1_9VIRU